MIRMYHPDLRPSAQYRPDDRPPPGAASLAALLGFVLLVLAALSPLLALSGLFAGVVCAATVRECRS